MSTGQFIRYPIETDPTTLAQEVYSYIQARAPQWVPNDGNLDVWIIQALTAVMAENRDLASDVPADIFRWFGATMVGLPPQDATASTVATTWAMIDTSGHTIPAGTQVGILDTAGNLIPFETVADVVVPTGSLVTATGGVILRSLDTGAASAALAGPAVTLTLIDVLDFVATVVAEAITTGGQDAEEDDAYLNRLSTHLRLLSTRPILPEDFAALARDITGVYRVVAIDGYDPSNGSSNNARTIAVAGVDSLGNDLSSTVKASVLASLQANREVNFVVNVINAQRSLIDVTYSVVMLPGNVAATIIAAVNANLTAYLNPATWGSDLVNDPQAWRYTPAVRFSEVAAIISNTAGVDYWTALTMGIHGGGLAAADVTLPGVAPLAVASTLTGAAV